MRLCLIAAVDEAGGIGKKGGIPWDCPSDRAFFRAKTLGGGRNGVMMGRRTYESIGGILEGRVNIVLSRRGVAAADPVLYCCRDFGSAVGLGEFLGLEELWIIGGREVYAEGLRVCDREDVFINRIAGEYGCDVFFPFDVLGETGAGMRA